MKAKNILIDIAVIVILIVILWGLNRIFIIKDINLYNYEGYMAQEKNTVDILVMGSSHSMNAIDSSELDTYLSESGINTKTFNMSITGMRFESMCYRLKEALKTQSPKLLVIETFSATPMSYSNPEVTRRYALDYMPLSINKLAYVYRYIDENRFSYIFPLLRYHYRWQELGIEDYEILNPRIQKMKSERMGINAFTEDVVWPDDDGYFNTDYSECNEMEPLDDEVYEALSEIMTIASERGMKVLFVSIPYKIQMGYSSDHLVKNNNYIRDKFCDNTDVFMLDMNRMYKDMNWTYDCMQDEGHVNTYGRSLVMPVLADYIRDNIDGLR